MTKLLSPTIRLAFAAGFSISIALSAARASGPIGGAIGSTTASANPLPGLPLNRDDKDITKTYGVAALSYSFLIADSVQAQFPGYDWVFAGAPSGPGSHFTPIDESAFYVSKYQPWVVNSPTLNSPGGTPYNRGVTNQDAGGVNFLLDYTPGGTDPVEVNFLQVFEVRINGGAPIILADNGGKGGPYYNENGASGVDSVDGNGVPLDATDTEAWLLDTPYVCESGFSGTGRGCPAVTAANDETITSYNDYFQTWIEATGTYDGVNYNVLWAGLSWGFDFTATDVPEPTTWAMLALGFAGLGAVGFRRGRKPAAATAFA
jgi:PEP-CTERM motif